MNPERKRVFKYAWFLKKNVSCGQYSYVDALYGKLSKK